LAVTVRPGLDDLGKKYINLSHLWRHPQKNKIQNFPIF